MKAIYVTFILLFLLSWVAIPAFAEPADAYKGQAEEMDGAAVMGDLFLARPLGVAATVLGAGVSIVALPFAIPSGSTKLVFKRLVADPFKFTFCRHLGSDM